MTPQERDLKLQLEEIANSESLEGGIPKLMELPKDQLKHVAGGPGFYQFEQYNI